MGLPTLSVTISQFGPGADQLWLNLERRGITFRTLATEDDLLFLKAKVDKAVALLMRCPK